MAKLKVRTTKHVERHRDGTIWAKGQKRNGVLAGYWEWFRKDGTRMRSGYFENGEQTGDWTTYDKTGAIYKVTTMKPKAAKPAPDFPPGLARPALSALEGAGYKRLSQLRSISDEKLLELHGMGPKALRILRAALKGGARR